MSNSITKRMIRVYNQMAGTTLFLSGMFQSPPENFHSSEEVEIDIIRSDEEVSIVIQDLSTGYRMNSSDLYTNKSFKPPINKEAITINSFDLLKRQAGSNPFESPDFRMNIISRMFNGMVKVERKIRRSMELQASQILQTGVLTLIDENGTALYTLDFQAKATHFPTAGVTWGGATSVPLNDISALAEIIRNDGLGDPDELIFGVDAFNAFIADSTVQALLENRRMDTGAVQQMQRRGDGGTYRGWVEIGNYRYSMWTYGGRYKHPQTGVKTPFVDPGKVIVRDSSARLDATFGAIPNIGREMGVQNMNLLPEMPGRITNEGGSMDLFTNVWLSQDGEQLFGGVGVRPLLVPTAIDSYGCLDTGL